MYLRTCDIAAMGAYEGVVLKVDGTQDCNKLYVKSHHLSSLNSS